MHRKRLRRVKAAQEPIGFAMDEGMLRGVKARAEGRARQAVAQA